MTLAPDSGALPGPLSFPFLGKPKLHRSKAGGQGPPPCCARAARCEPGGRGVLPAQAVGGRSRCPGALRAGSGTTWRCSTARTHREWMLMVPSSSEKWSNSPS